ncbi:histone deacetylase 9 isoform X2 [Spea bombifrons]|uniref:histone deacetylase 9 isoform X2 n=1 Tax=Spea bombifrons TaxID=233779 RepID=UPI0023497DE4|nr:histone deacetylase 9 isoform X2 [Spea bombifrons]
MLQTIYESESCFCSDGVSTREQQRMHSMISSDVKSEVPVGMDPITPLDLRTDLRTVIPIIDPVLREKQLQQELLLIQQQQQIQKQLLIAEFQKQHENLTRQHQAQLQEHLKLQQELLAMKQQQELLEREKEHKMEQQRQEQEVERHRREQQQISHSRNKDRGKERAVASTEVKQKLQEFLLSKSATKESLTNGTNHSMGRHPKLWYTAAHHTSLDQSSPPLTSPSYKYTLPGAQESKDDFPLRKTASEPNLKVRSRLKQKVAERRSSPLLRRKEGNVPTTYKKRIFEVAESSVSSCSPVSGPSSPNNGPVGMNVEKEASVLSSSSQTEHLASHHQHIVHPEKSLSLLNLYNSPSLPNITLGLSAAVSQISASSSLKEKQRYDPQALRQGVSLPGQYGGSLAASSAHASLEGKSTSSHQALLQHLLLKEQIRQQKLLVAGGTPLLQQSPLASKDRVSPSGRVAHKLPRHRPLYRTQSAPLPQNTLAQLVIQQQHQQFLEKQKQYQQQIHMNKLRQPGHHLEEAEEELHGDNVMQEESVSSSTNMKSQSSADVRVGHLRSVKVKEEPPDSEDEIQTHFESEQKTAFVQQQVPEHQRISKFQLYQAQMDTVGMTGLDKHRHVSRAQSSPAASTLPHPASDQPVEHVYKTGRTP